MRKLLLIGIATSTVQLAAQDCSNGRYHSEVFTEVDVTSAIPFGSNTAVAGGEQTLYMDVYQPVGDTLSQRPVVLVAFGGSFVAGNRADVALVCESFARRGFVAVAPDYRIGFFLPNSLTTTAAVLRGAHDMKACVRFLRGSAETVEDPYRLDSERILIGGFSAGAISALHAAYLNDDAEWPTVLDDQFEALGGIEGTSGSAEQSSEVLGVYSFSGAIGDTLWLNPGDVPLCSVHEVGDEVVPYYTQEVSVFGFPTGLIASGSHDVHRRADHLGMDNCLLTYPGSGHVAYVNSDPENSIGFVMDFCADLVCGMDAACGNVMAAVAGPNAQEGSWRCYPNPAQNILWIDGGANVSLQIFSSTGQLVGAMRVEGEHHAMDLSGMAEGLYTIQAPGRPSLRVVHTH